MEPKVCVIARAAEWLRVCARNQSYLLARGVDKLDDGYVSLLLLDPLGFFIFLSFELFVITASASSRT